MSEKYLELIGKLMRQAEGTDNDNEAAVFMDRAQRLATANGIDLAVARAHVGKHEKRETPIIKNIVVGTRGKRGLASFVRLFLQIAEANDVQCNIAHNSTYVIAFGYESDIEVCEALYASLVIQMVRASNAYLKTGEYKTEMVWRTVTKREDGYSYRTQDYAPVPGQTARRNFQEAFASKVGVRLKASRKEAIAEVVAQEREREQAPEVVSTGTELVLVAKEVEIADFYKAKSTARGSWRGGSAHRNSGRSPSASNAGTRAGAHARLGGEKAITSGNRALSS